MKYLLIAYKKLLNFRQFMSLPPPPPPYVYVIGRWKPSHLINEIVTPENYDRIYWKPTLWSCDNQIRGFANWVKFLKIHDIGTIVLLAKHLFQFDMIIWNIIIYSTVQIENK